MRNEMYTASAGRNCRFSSKRTVIAIFPAIRVWQERTRQRRALASLDDHLLRDIGLSRAQAVSESAKPFWRA